MSEAHAIANRPSMRAIEWCLRITIALQCVGVASWTSSTETPAFETLCYTWDWSEETVSWIELASVYALPGASAILLLAALAPRGRWPFAVEWATLSAITVWQCWIAFTTWYQAEGLPEGYFASLVFAEQAVRMAAPVALALWLAANARAATAAAPSDPYRDPLLRIIAVWLLRLSAAATFLAHGYEAWIGHPPFVDLIIGAGLRADWRVEQSTAEQWLAVIGGIDFVLSAMVLLGRFRTAALYMAIWGLLTASSRIAHSGTAAYFETLMRAANAGAPLAIFLYWQLMMDAAKTRGPQRAETEQSSAKGEKGRD